MSRRTSQTIAVLDEHPNLAEIVGLLAQLAHVRDSDLPLLAAAWDNSTRVAAARHVALSPDSPLVVEVLAAFDAITALFADDLRGEAAYVTVDTEVTVTAVKAVRDAVAAAYARPVLAPGDHAALIRPWRAVYPESTIDEPDLGPHSDEVKQLLSLLPMLSTRCHDSDVRRLYDALVDRSFADESDRAEAREAAFQAAVLTSRRRVWALVRRSATEGVCRPCQLCRVPVAEDRDLQRVTTLCVDAACALVVADTLPDATTSVLTEPVRSVIPLQRGAST